MEKPGSKQGGAGDREHPRPDDAARAAPADRGEPARGSHSNNRTGDGVRGADGNAEDGISNQRESTRGFGGKSSKRSELGDALTHCLDDAPSAGHRAAAHGEMAADNHPVRHGELFEKT